MPQAHSHQWVACCSRQAMAPEYRALVQTGVQTELRAFRNPRNNKGLES